ncbi:MAG: PEP-CTERM sorting domain-containing protein [Phycisphaerae bacterium]
MRMSSEQMAKKTVAALMVLSISGAASAAWANPAVDIQFGGPAAPFSGNPGAYTGDGVTAPIWNAVVPLNWINDGVTNNLVDSAGTATSIGVTAAYSGYFPDSAASLLDQYVYANSGSGNSVPGSGTVDIYGLTPNASYQLYLYSQNSYHNNSRTTFSITPDVSTPWFVSDSGSPALGSNAYTVNSLNSSSNAFVENANYVIFNATADSAGTIWINYAASALTSTSYAPQAIFNGLQLISMPQAGSPELTSTVPEPAAMALLACGACGVLLLKRKQMFRRKAWSS